MLVMIGGISHPSDRFSNSSIETPKVLLAPGKTHTSNSMNYNEK